MPNAAPPSQPQSAPLLPGESAAGQELSVCFTLGDELFAIPAVHVLKVVSVSALTRLPRLPKAVRGITQHRGRIVTVMELGPLLYGDDESEGAERTQIMVLDRGEKNLGLLVDHVKVIVALPLANATRPTELPCIHLLANGEQVIRVVNTEILLDQALEQVTGAAGGLD